MREVFVAYVGLLKQRAAEQYKFELLMWRIATAFGGNSKPPSPPDIIRDPRTRRIRAGVKKPDA